MGKISFSRSTGGFKNTTLTPVELTPQQLSNTLKALEIGAKDGSYFCRATGTYRSNKTLSDKSNILVLDGDSSINPDTGEVVAGAPCPELIHKVLTNLWVSHIIYSSHSNGKKGDIYNKYRVIIFVDYDREQLSILLEHYHVILHDKGLLLVNPKENRSWAQPWYYPRSTPNRAHLFKHFDYFDGNIQIASEIVSDYRKAHPELKSEPSVIDPTQSSLVRLSNEHINPIQLFNEHWRSPVNYLMTQNYRFKGARLLPPGKTDKSTAGVQVCLNCKDAVERVYSHHGSDLLNDGFPHDSFDCFKILEHGGDETAALKAVGEMFTINGQTLEKHNQFEFMKSTKKEVASFDAMEVGL